MKPSERIKELFGKEYFNNKQVGDIVHAIIVYLDEQYEQQKPKPLSKELCIKGGNFGCTCESCTEELKTKILNHYN